MVHPALAFASPRKLPRPRDLSGTVAVLDIAFASEAGGRDFDQLTFPFIEGLGARLVAWVDHHDSIHHRRFTGDARFTLSTKAEHGACPEMITPEVVARAGPVETLVCHVDFDGLASAAKWMRGGVECYFGCDVDARAIDTRIGAPSQVARRIDRALRARPRDAALFGIVVRHLASGLADPSLWDPIDAAGALLAPLEVESRRLAQRFTRVGPNLAVCDATIRDGRYDKTLLLLLGQERAAVALVLDGDTATFAAPFNSGINLLRLLDISGGMPTRVSVPRARIEAALLALGAEPDDARAISMRR